MLSEVIKNNEEINKMLIRIMQKRREEGKSFQVSTKDGPDFDKQTRVILENEFKRCILTYEAEFYPYKVPNKEQEVFIENKEKKFPDCHGGFDGISVTPNMQAGISKVFEMLENFNYLIREENIEAIKNAMNENENSDYKYVGSTADQLDFFGYLKSINGTDLDWFMSVLAHEAMHAFGVSSGNVVMKEGATEEFTREICEKYHIMLSPISHTQEAEFVRKLEMVVGKDVIKEASFFNHELFNFRDKGLLEIIKECPDMEFKDLQEIFNYTRYKERTNEEDEKVNEFKSKYPSAFEKLGDLIASYNDKNNNERYDKVSKEFENKLNLTPGSYKKYIDIFGHFYQIAKSSKKNIDIYRDLYTKKFSELNLPDPFKEAEALMNELSIENGFEIKSFEDLMKPINEYIKDKTLEVDNEPKDYTKLLEHQNKELAALRDICIKMSIPIGDEEQSISQGLKAEKISVIDSAEEAINENTRTGKVNEQAQTMKAKQQERMNPNIEKEGNDLGLDDE